MWRLAEWQPAAFNVHPPNVSYGEHIFQFFVSQDVPLKCVQFRLRDGVWFIKWEAETFRRWVIVFVCICFPFHHWYWNLGAHYFSYSGICGVVRYSEICDRTNQMARFRRIAHKTAKVFLALVFFFFTHSRVERFAVAFCWPMEKLLIWMEWKQKDPTDAFWIPLCSGLPRFFDKWWISSILLR